MEDQQYLLMILMIFLAGNSTNEIQRKINKTINTLTDWFERNRLIINKEKTIAISFHHPQKMQFVCPPIKLNDTFHFISFYFP
jgi:hypothetical protein